MSELGFSDLKLVGDELYFDGELVAVLTTNCSATELGRFTDLIEFGEPEEEDCDCPPRPTRLHKQECACYRAEDGTPEPLDMPSNIGAGELSDTKVLMNTLERLSRGGLVRLSDVKANIRS